MESTKKLPQYHGLPDPICPVQKKVLVIDGTVNEVLEIYHEAFPPFFPSCSEHLLHGLPSETLAVYYG
jgi:hypothetical protein